PCLASSCSSTVGTVARPPDRYPVDQFRVCFHVFTSGPSRHGYFQLLPRGVRHPAFPQSIRRLGIVNQNALADLITPAFLRRFFCTRRDQQLLNLPPRRFKADAQVLQYMSCYALALDQKAQQEVLGADVVVSHACGFFEGGLDDLLDARGRDDLLDDDPLMSSEDR